MAEPSARAGKSRTDGLVGLADHELDLDLRDCVLTLEAVTTRLAPDHLVCEVLRRPARQRIITLECPCRFERLSIEVIIAPAAVTNIVWHFVRAAILAGLLVGRVLRVFA